MRWVATILVLIGVYCADVAFFQGRLSADAALMVQNFGTAINRHVRDLLRPLGT